MSEPSNGNPLRDDPDLRVDEALHSISMSIPALLAMSENFPDNFHREDLQTVTFHLSAICFMAKIIEINLENAKADRRRKTLLYLEEIEKSALADPIKKLLDPILTNIKKMCLEKTAVKTA